MNGRVIWRSGLADLPKTGVVVVMATLAQVEPLSPTERDLAEAPQRPQARGAFLARRTLARRAAAARLGVAAADVVIGHAPSGAPFIAAPQTALRISVSGRDDFCAVALAEAPVGVDMEPLDPPAEPAWAVLHEEERRALAAMEKGARHAAFLRIWTAKEAYLKALGQGFSREPSEIGVEQIGQEEFALRDDRRGAPPAVGEWAEMTLGAQQFILACVCLA